VPNPRDAALLAELTPVAESLLERHLAQAKEWFPHEVVPWSQGRDFEAGVAWTPDDSLVELRPEVRSALFVNLLTEDNLPYYFRTIEQTYGRDGAWGEWVRRWTAEEGRHAIAIRDYLMLTRAIDPVGLERARMAQVQCGQVPEPDSPIDALAYVAIQELATRISHLNTGRAVGDSAGYEVLKRVASDENRHHLFYRDLVAKALEIDPSWAVQSIDRQVRGFEMPGTGIVDYSEHAKAIARAGIYDFAVHHDQILQPVLVTHWKVDRIEGLDADGEAARVSVLRYMERVGKAGRRTAARREAVAAAV
jgi:acyl-[acyl-carrier-protein] desaturase